VRGIPFEDFDVYVEKFAFEESLLDNVDNELGVAWYFTREILWDVLIRGGSDLFSVPVEVILSFVSFVSIFGFSFVVLVRGGALGLLLLINPLVIDYSMSQLRMALAMSFLLLALFVRNKIVVLLLVLMTFLIHTVVFAFVSIYFFIKYVPVLLSRIGFEVSGRSVALVVAVLTCVAIGPLREILLGYVGDRRAEYSVQGGSLSYASFWIVFLVAMLFQQNRYFDVKDEFCSNGYLRGRFSESSLCRDSVSSQCFFSMPKEWPVNCISLACLTIFCLGTLMGIPVARFVSSVFPLLIISFLELSAGSRFFVSLVGVVYIFLQWIYWVV